MDSLILGMRDGTGMFVRGMGCVILQRFDVTIDNRLPYGRGSEALLSEP